MKCCLNLVELIKNLKLRDPLPQRGTFILVPKKSYDLDILENYLQDELFQDDLFYSFFSNFSFKEILECCSDLETFVEKQEYLDILAHIDKVRLKESISDLEIRKSQKKFIKKYLLIVKLKATFQIQETFNFQQLSETIKNDYELELEEIVKKLQEFLYLVSNMNPNEYLLKLIWQKLMQYFHKKQLQVLEIVLFLSIKLQNLNFNDQQKVRNFICQFSDLSKDYEEILEVSEDIQGVSFGNVMAQNQSLEYLKEYTQSKNIDGIYLNKINVVLLRILRAYPEQFKNLEKDISIAQLPILRKAFKKHLLRKTLNTIKEESVQVSDETDYRSSRSFAIDSSFAEQRRNRSQENHQRKQIRVKEWQIIMILR